MVVETYIYMDTRIFMEYVDTDLNGDPGSFVYRTEDGDVYHTSLDKAKKAIEREQGLYF